MTTAATLSALTVVFFAGYFLGFLTWPLCMWVGRRLRAVSQFDRDTDQALALVRSIAPEPDESTVLPFTPRGA